MGIVLFLILLGAMGASVCTQPPQVGFSPLSPASAATASQGGAFPQAGVDGVPATVEQLTVAFDGWGRMSSTPGNTSVPACSKAT